MGEQGRAHAMRKNVDRGHPTSEPTRLVSTFNFGWSTGRPCKGNCLQQASRVRADHSSAARCLRQARRNCAHGAVLSFGQSQAPHIKSIAVKNINLRGIKGEKQSQHRLHAACTVARRSSQSASTEQHSARNSAQYATLRCLVLGNQRPYCAPRFSAGYLNHCETWPQHYTEYRNARYAERDLLRGWDLSIVLRHAGERGRATRGGSTRGRAYATNATRNLIQPRAPFIGSIAAINAATNSHAEISGELERLGNGVLLAKHSAIKAFSSAMDISAAYVGCQ